MAYCNSNQWELCLSPRLSDILSYAQVIVTPATLLPLAWITVLLRCYVKKRIANDFRNDDWLMVISLALFTSLIAMSIRASSLDFGHRMVDISAAEIEELLQMWLFGELAYLLTAVTVKLSIAILLSRYTIRPGYRVVTWATAILSTVAGCVFVFVIILQCSPISFYWDKSLPGVCKSQDTFTLAAYVNATISAMTATIFAIISICVSWNKEMDIGSRLATCVVLTLGILSVISVVSIIRVKYVDNLSSSGDDSFSLFVAGILSDLETGFAIIAASLATCRPLLRVFGKSIPRHPTNSGYLRRKKVDARDVSSSRTETMDASTIVSERSSNLSQSDLWSSQVGVRRRSGVDFFKPNAMGARQMSSLSPRTSVYEQFELGGLHHDVESGEFEWKKVRFQVLDGSQSEWRG